MHHPSKKFPFLGCWIRGDRARGHSVSLQMVISITIISINRHKIPAIAVSLMTIIHHPTTNLSINRAIISLDTINLRIITNHLQILLPTITHINLPISTTLTNHIHHPLLPTITTTNLPTLTISNSSSNLPTNIIIISSSNLPTNVLQEATVIIIMNPTAIKVLQVTVNLLLPTSFLSIDCCNQFLD